MGLKPHSPARGISQGTGEHYLFANHVGIHRRIFAEDINMFTRLAERRPRHIGAQVIPHSVKALMMAAPVVIYCMGPGTASAQVAGSTQPLTHSDNLWTTTSIPVCWERPTAGNRQGRQWTRDAIRSSWERVSNIRFTGWRTCSSRSKGIRIKIADEGPHTKGLGRSLDGKRNGMVLNFQFRNWSKGCATSREFCIRAIAVHEFGHALGFAHEHNRDDRSMCSDEPQGTEPTFYITSYDPNSIMNYCSSEWSNGGRLSALDVAGVRSIYGPFNVETPAAVSFRGTINIVDGEVGRNERGSRDISGTLRLTASRPSRQQRFSYCVGGEVRVQLDVKATILPGTPIVTANATAKMFEGTSCRTRDFEDKDHAVTSLSVGSLETPMRLRLENSSIIGSNDEATINLTFNRLRGAAGGGRTAEGCSSCVSEARRARFAQPPTRIVTTTAVQQVPKGTFVLRQGAVGIKNAQACADALQGRVAWNYKGNKKWPRNLLSQLCSNGAASAEPARCFERVMHHGVSWGRGTKWSTNNAIKLCNGVKNANATIACFSRAVRKGMNWQRAMSKCQG